MKRKSEIVKAIQHRTDLGYTAAERMARKAKPEAVDPWTGKPCEDCQGTGKRLHDGEKKRRTCCACEGTGDANRETDSQFQATPSPLPWKVAHRQHGQVFIASGDMGVAVTSRGISKGNEDEATVEADAALIVRAVNAHAGHLSLFRAIKARLNGEWDQPDLKARGHLLTCSDDDILLWVDEALRAAGEEV